ncbi:TPA: FISUMP domain-containing protein [Elizabethkingia anophelis]
MKRKFYNSTAIFLLSSVTLINSCRSTDTDNNIISGASGTSKLNINLVGTTFSDSQNSAKQASLNKGLIANPINNVQKFNVLLTPSSVMTAELIDKSALATVADTNKNLIADVTYPPNEKVPKGTAFRVILYKYDDNSYYAHQDYIVGGETKPFIVKNGTKYTVIVYSYNTSTLPIVTSGELSDLNSALINYDNTNRDFSHKISWWDFNSNYSGNYTLNITLNKKVAQITTTINAGSLGNISDIKNALISPHYTNGTITLANGNIQNRTNLSTGENVNFLIPTAAPVQISQPLFINADTGGQNTGSFSADVTIGGVTKKVSLPNIFSITPGRRYFLNVNLTKKCGAYVAPGVWKDFMCHNLGADTNADPFTASSSIFGAKYQWGRASEAISQMADISTTSYISGWNSTPAPSTSWSDSNKTANDPCPNGYRLPTSAEWRGVLTNNTMTRSGDWSGSGYGNAIKIGDNLLLPATGYRFPGDGTLNPRNVGYYWSSTYSGRNYGGALYFDQNTQAVYDTDMPRGINIRCIAQ